MMVRENLFRRYRGGVHHLEISEVCINKRYGGVYSTMVTAMVEERKKVLNGWQVWERLG